MVASKIGFARHNGALVKLRQGLWLVALTLAVVLGAKSPIQGQCLPTSWVVTGTVMGVAGEPIVGVDIDILDPFTGVALILSQDVTLADGSFTTVICEVAPPGFYDIHFQTAPSMPYFDLVVQSVNLTGNTDLGTVTLEDASIVSGRVIGETAQPLPEVDLDFFDPVSGQQTAFSGDFTDDEGIFSVKVFADFWDIRFTQGAGTSPVALVPRLIVDVALFDAVDLGDVVLRVGHELTGSVEDASGSPVVGADIDVSDPITDEEFVTPGDNTDASGNFQVLVPEGSWELEVDPPTGSSLVSSLTDITVPIGGVDVGVLTLPDGFTVSGTVADTSGDIIPDTDLDFFISATGIEIPTAHDNANSSGNFSVQVEPNTYDIAFRPKFASGAAPLVIESIAVTAATNLGVVTLPDGYALTGTVVAGVVPVAAVEITLNDSATGAEVYVFGNDTDGLGAFSIRQVSGIYDLTATPPVSTGYSPRVIPDLVLDSDTNVVIDLLGGVPPSPPDPIENFECVASSGSVQLSWILANVDYDLIQIERDGVFLTNLPGSSISFTDQFAPQELLQYTAIAIRDFLTSAPSSCSVDNSPPPTSPPLPVSGLTCTENPSGVDLEWQLGEPDYDAIEVYFDGVLLEVLSGQAVGFFHDGVLPGLHQWEIVALRSSLESRATPCSIDVTGGGGGPIFLRGDANEDLSLNVADAIFILGYLFIQGPSGSCLDAMDVNDSGSVNIADAVRILLFLFSAGVPPELPWPTPGEDPTADSLPCS